MLTLRTFLRRALPYARCYHSGDHPSPILSNTPETAILNEALLLVPAYGFTRDCITKATRNLGYPDSTGLIVKDSDLPVHWLKTLRHRLEQYALDPNSPLHPLADEYDRATNLMQQRLLYNNEIDILELVPLLAMPDAIAKLTTELHNLSDDIAFYAGDDSHDFAWYTKRMGLSTIYVLLELYQMQNRHGVNQFVADKIGAMKNMGLAYNNVEEWALFNGISAYNLIKSQLLRG